MAFLLFKLDQLFILLVPDLVVGICGPFNCPNEPDFVQTFLSINSKFVIDMTLPLRMNPQPKRLVFFVLKRHQTIAILSFKLDQLFILLVPELVVWFEGVGAVSFPSEPDFVKKSLPM
jgi:hypothetical protein